jgi:AcrR family transcriptional regulator
MAMETAKRREQLKAALVAAAEWEISTGGLRGLKARELAYKVGCAVGAIYNVVSDLDDLILLVNARTLDEIEHKLVAIGPANTSEEATAQLVRLALVYLDFAAEHTPRWRALFDHRLPEGRELPDWYVASQSKLFAYVEQPVAVLLPSASPEQRTLLARSLFSAVHGMVMLGLEEKLQRIPLPALREQITAVVTAIGRGMRDAR